MPAFSPLTINLLLKQFHISMQSVGDDPGVNVNDNVAKPNNQHQSGSSPMSCEKKQVDQAREETPTSGSDKPSTNQANAEQPILTGKSSSTDDTAVHDDSEECLFALFPTVPSLKYYDRPLHMIRNCMKSQAEYEKDLRKKRESANFVDPHEIIGVECPDKKDSEQGSTHLFEVERQVLSRSPFFNEYFRSEDFLQGCETVFTFVEDPATCFFAIKIYLEEGVDRFSAENFEHFVTTRGTARLSNVDTMELLMRTHKMACKLRLQHLASLALTVMHTLGSKMDASCCVTLASLVFGQGYFDLSVENFIFKHVGKNFQELDDMTVWHEILEKHKESRLGNEWAEMDILNKRVLSMLLEKSDTDAETIQRRLSALSSINVGAEGGSMELTRDSLKAALTASELSNQTNGGKDVLRSENRPPFVRSITSEKTWSVLGLPAKDFFSDSEMLQRRCFETGTKKARTILGMHSSGGGEIGRVPPTPDPPDPPPEPPKPQFARRAKQIAQGGFKKRGVE